MAGQTQAPQYSHWLLIPTTIFLVWAILLTGVRWWAKLKMSWAFHDNIFTAAFVVALAQVVTLYIAESYGYDSVSSNTSADGIQRSKQCLFAGQVLYVLSLGLSKCSTALFLGSLTRNALQQRVSVLIAIVMGIWTLASIFAVAFRGNLAHPWTTLNGTTIMFTRWLGIEASGIALEVILWVFSITLVWGLNMRVFKRLKVVSLFGSRLMLVPVVIGRLYFLDPSVDNGGSTYANTLADIFTEAAMLYSIMAECMTCLKPFLQPFHDGYGFSSSSNNGYGSNPSRDPYAQLSHISTDREIKRPTKVMDREVDVSTSVHRQTHSRPRRERDDSMFKLRPDYTSFTVNVEGDARGGGKAGRHRSTKSKGSDEDDIELLHRPVTSGIQQTTTVSVVGENLKGQE